MSTPQYNAQQVINFQKALQSGQITQAQFDTAISYEQSLPGSPTYKPATTPTTTTSEPTTYTVPIVTHDPSKPLTAVDGGSTAWTLSSSTTTQPTTTPNVPINAMPTNPTDQVIQDSNGTWAIQGSTVTPTTDSSGQPTGFLITPPAPEQQAQPKPEMVEPTLQNIMTNPIGVAGTFANILGLASDKLPDSPLKTVTDFYVGAGGQITNQGTQIKNAMSSVIGGKSTPLPFTPQNQTQQAGMVAEVIAEAAAVAVVAPEVLPISTTAIIGTGILNVGISQGMRFIPSNPLTGEYQGKIGTPLDMANEALFGEVFAVGGIGALKGLGYVAETQMNVAGRVAAQVAWTAPGRVALFTGIGAGVGGATGGVQGAASGAVFGLGFGIGGEVIGKAMPGIRERLAPIQERIPSISEHLPNISNPVKGWAENVVTNKEIIRSQTELDLYSHEIYTNGQRVDLADITGEHLTLQQSRTQNIISQLFNVKPRSLAQGTVDIPDVLRSEFGNADLSNVETSRISATSKNQPTVNVFDVHTGQTVKEPYFANAEAIAPDTAKAAFMDNLKGFDLTQKIIGKTEAGYDVVKMPKEMEGFSTINEYKDYLITNEKMEGIANQKNIDVLTQPFINEKVSFDFTGKTPEQITQEKMVAKATSTSNKVITDPYVNEKLSFNINDNAEGLVSTEEFKVANNSLTKGKQEPLIMPTAKHMLFESEVFEFSNQPKSGMFTESKKLGDTLRPRNSVRNPFADYNYKTSIPINPFSTQQSLNQKNKGIPIENQNPKSITYTLKDQKLTGKTENIFTGQDRNFAGKAESKLFEPTQKSSARTSNPFFGYPGKQSSQQPQEEEQYYTMPGQAQRLNTTHTQTQNILNNTPQSIYFERTKQPQGMYYNRKPVNPQTAPTTFWQRTTPTQNIQNPATTYWQRQTTPSNPAQKNYLTTLNQPISPKIETGIESSIFQDTGVKQNQFVTPFVEQNSNTKITPITISIVTPRNQPPPQASSKNDSGFKPAFFDPFGGKAMEFGGNRPDNQGRKGLNSRKRIYPIAKPEDFWG